VQIRAGKEEIDKNKQLERKGRGNTQEENWQNLSVALMEQKYLGEFFKIEEGGKNNENGKEVYQ